MLFFYVVFLKEREQTCLCKARMREFLRRRGENTNTCPLDNQADVGARKEFGPKSMIAAVENVWIWYTKIREWFHENDPSIVSETAFALGKSLPKNDNGNFDFPSKSLRNIGKLHVLSNNAQPENQESATSIRKKRLDRHCLFRHCSGLVCPRKFMKRRRNKQHCLHLRVSQEAISDYWKMCDKSIRDENDIDNVKMHQENADTKERTIIKEIHEHKGEILKNDKYKAEKIPSKRDTNEEDVKLESEHKSPCVCADNPCNNCDICPLSLRIVETKYEENENSKKFNNFINICDTDAKISPKYMNENTSNALKKKNNLCKTSISNFGKTINAGDYMNSILYHDIRKKYASTVKKKSSKNYLEIEKSIELKLTPKSEMGTTGIINSYQESNVDRLENNFLDNMRMYSLKQKQKHNLKHPVNKSVTRLQNKFRNIDNSGTQKNIYPVSSYKNTMYQRKLPELPCQNCYYDTKGRNYDSQWTSNKKQSLSHLHPYPSTQPQHNISRNLQSQKSNYQCECLKTKKKFDSIINRKFLLSHDVDSLKSKQQAEKPTLDFIFKNRRSNRSRNSTNSLYSSSITSTITGEKPIRDNLNTYQHSTYKSSRYTMPSNDQYKNNKNSTEIDSTCLLSSSSSLSSSRRCYSWTLLPQNSIYHKREPISSSSCTNIHRWKRRYPVNEKGTSTCLSSTSCSLSSLSTFRDYYLDETEKETRQIQKSWRKPKFRPQKKKIIYTDERHVRWNVKNTY
ncbi:hypothetical protein K0M31_014431 [Melipona bicolor]|uniref:Uncharacterized protein n=1 Tax=Melipona bicolor TaxID=60889 RepID=A0AA40G999_9HYME|nr:hypothetical protein K0M31_014431 [Melipona bicolor]